MVSMKFLIALLASLFFVNTMAISNYEAAEVFGRRASALEARAEQLQDLAAVYRRALTSIDGEAEVLERGFLSGLLKKPKVNLHCDSTVPASLCAKAKEKVQKAYGKDKRWHKFKNGEIFVARLIWGPQNPVKSVSCAFYNEAKRPITAPSLTVAL
ncbi:hypothetical protein FA13DRAFT_1741554 [Coprinellus micaceus]|uniref:Uncharacterized protein n=1 Tax=Coprinellus micaceus TaxID=71717 RepID=A0A4Y7SJ06_COPMI|nr:hypothetical protein FA13DRAFT_1741554 [Coprinellus micaceus]